MGAGIAADPLSPDFNPLGASEETPAPSGFGGMLHPRRERQQASHLVTRTGRDTLAGLSAVTPAASAAFGPKPVNLASAPSSGSPAFFR